MAERVLPTTSVGERTFRGAGVQEGGTGEIPTIFKFCRRALGALPSQMSL